MSAQLPPCQESPGAQIARIAFTGAVFAGLGAVFNLYVPAFHKPTQLLHQKLDVLNKKCAEYPATKHIFAGNQLTGNSKITEFLAINIMETPFIAGAIVSLGLLTKMTGIKFQALNNCKSPLDTTFTH